MSATDPAAAAGATLRSDGADRLIGRTGELDVLHSALAGTRAGSGRLVLCSGPAGIGKSRLAQEMAGTALATGIGVAWGRCIEADGAPPMWPWRRVFSTLGLDLAQPTVDLATGAAARFGFLDHVAESLLHAAAGSALLVVLDDLHWADDSSLHLLRHLADRLPDAALTVLATYRDAGQGGALHQVLPDLHRVPALDVVRLSDFSPAEVRDQLVAVGADGERADDVFAVTSGNPLFVRETARALIDGSWRQDRPPHTVLDIVRDRVERLDPQCRRLVQAAAVVGRTFTVPLVAAVVGLDVDDCLDLLDRAVAAGLVERVGSEGDPRFVHALTRDAVEASLSTSDRTALHRAAATALETRWATAPDDHAAEIARHWLALAALGEAEPARTWAIRAAEVAARGLAFEEAVRLYRSALGVDAPWPDPEAQLAVHLGIAASSRLAGHVADALSAAREAARLAAGLGRVELLAAAALVVEPVTDPMVNTVLGELSEQALAQLDHADGTPHAPLRARLLARSSQLDFYAGRQDDAAAASRAALDLARTVDDDLALLDALRARQDCCPGPAGRDERLRLATEMLAVAGRTGSAQATMWGSLWRVDALIERGDLPDAAAELVPLERAAVRVGGPANAWHVDRVRAALAQAQGRASEAVAAAARAFDRMSPLEPAAATGAYLGVHCGLARHFQVPKDVLAFVRGPLQPPPQFVAMAQVARSVLLLAAGFPDEAAAHFRRAGEPEELAWPAFFVASGSVLLAQAGIGLGRPDALAAATAGLERFRGEHVVGSGIHYLGPAELTLGWVALVQGRLDAAVTDLEVAVVAADSCNAPGFAAEARHHLAAALLTRSGAGDHDRAWQAARESNRMIRLLGMSALDERSAVLLDRARPGQAPALSSREVEVSRLVAEGLTNRQIADRLVISERTAGNHVQHILTKLGFGSRSQIVAWWLRSGQARPRE